MDDVEKGRKFLEGLRLEFQQQLSLVHVEPYADVVFKAIMAEENLTWIATLQRTTPTPQFMGGSGSVHSHLKPRRDRFKKGKRCPKYKRRHAGKECHKKPVVCYSCGEAGHYSNECSKNKAETTKTAATNREIVCYNCNQLGHISRNCPKKEQPLRIEEGKGTRHGRVYNMTKEEVETDPAVIQGTLFLLSTPVHALIDPGATH